MAAPGDARRWQLLLLLLAGLMHGASSVFVVKNGNGTACIMADFSATFLMNYDTKSGSKNLTLDLPPDAEVLNTSSCGKENTSDPSLMIAFGSGHTLTLNFTRNATRYGVQMLSFVYNLSDTDVFPNASSKGLKTVESTTDIRADIDKKYRCVSSNQIHMNNITMTLRDATIQAYLSSNNFSKEETHCKQDDISPTTAPPSPKPTTRPPPSPVPENPSVSKYNVSGNNGTCLLANMGIQLNITYEKNDNTTVTRVFNINPNDTKASGSCTSHSVVLELRGGVVTLLVFSFGMNASSSRFFLQEIQLNTTLPDAREPTFKAVNSSLRALQATVGNSYRCNAEESIQVTKAFSVNVFKVWVQAFKVEGDKFGSVEECQLDENNMLIPIAVGGALAGLVLVVLIAYLIGRKRSHAGYQTI
ncbi:lysosome-associated membrane glycoprotein 1 isoform X1 [Trichechus manatus latirostris]|uniref:Lysosome-associated membrane glycoprotein 1 n=1 Tax=Trichechus manatus latirostris TaxID=127582 RepID=A0A2Y9RFN9_TRIMA|nr:lysosome-associated membrane glycoprotein 1 isoform X1 [Trichechus manatus latirostris]